MLTATILGLLPVMSVLQDDTAADPAATEGPATITQTIPDTSHSFELVPIPAGTVDMQTYTADGKEGEIASVEVGPFFLGTLEVTWDLYDVLVFRQDLPETTDEDPDGISRPTSPYMMTDRGWGHAGFPAISISAQGAESYCKWLTAKTGRTYRLPTEAEWEHAARAGTARDHGRWFFGDKRSSLKEYAWFLLSSEKTTHPVGQKAPSPWGLFDIYGNVGEWCTSADGGHVLRGGSFLERHSGASSYSRQLPVPDWNATDPQIPKSPWWLADGPFAGFRVLCEPFEPEAEPAEEPADADPSAGGGGE